MDKIVSFIPWLLGPVRGVESFKFSSMGMEYISTFTSWYVHNYIHHDKDIWIDKNKNYLTRFPSCPHQQNVSLVTLNPLPPHSVHPPHPRVQGIVWISYEFLDTRIIDLSYFNGQGMKNMYFFICLKTPRLYVKQGNSVARDLQPTCSEANTPSPLYPRPHNIYPYLALFTLTKNMFFFDKNTPPPPTTEMRRKHEMRFVSISPPPPPQWKYWIEITTVPILSTIWWNHKCVEKVLSWIWQFCKAASLSWFYASECKEEEVRPRCKKLFVGEHYKQHYT